MNNLSVIFVTSKKHPGFKGWQKYARSPQSNEDIINLFKERGNSNTAYSYFTGIGGLIDLDFDWEWTYHVSKRYFKDRMETRTLKTPNGGYRALFIVDEPNDYLKFKDRPPKVEIHGKPTHHVIVQGKVKDDNGNLQQYDIINPKPIRHDPEILTDMKVFLQDINKQCSFLEYNCISQSIKKKHNELTHEQRTSIGSFFAAEKIDIKTAIDFFRCTDDFDYEITKYHLEKIYEKEFNHPKCETLQKHFNHQNNDCNRCFRKCKTNESVLNKNGVDMDDEYRSIKLRYNSEHLKGFQDLAASTRLFGNEYKLIFKALWYTLFSVLIATCELKLGQIKTDGRISVLFPIKSGGGKEGIKNTIKAVVGELSMDCTEPTSLHAEQLVGKVILLKKEGYLENYGYLNDDYVIIDEGFNLLTSNELHYLEARKYIRTALDPYKRNTITKRQTDIPKDKALTYNPRCPVTIFVQPFQYENDQLVMEGDIRRFIVPYIKMIGIDRTDAFINRIYEENDDEKSLISFCNLLNSFKASIDDSMNYTFDPNAIERFADLAKDLRNRGFSRSEKIRYFTDNIEFTIQNYLLKFSVIQALQDRVNIIRVKHVELAYLDLFEILEHTYEFIEAKIPGMMNYGEGWLGAVQNDQICLRWLQQKGALLGYDSDVSISDYSVKVEEVFKVKERQARSIIRDQVSKGWITKKQGKPSKVWLAFKPTEETGNCGNQPQEVEYESLIKKYHKNDFCSNRSIATTATSKLTKQECGIKKCVEETI